MKKEEIKYPRYYRDGKTHKLTDKERKEIVLLKDAGWRVEEIAEEFDITDTAVYYWVSELQRKNAKKRANARYLIPNVKKLHSISNKKYKKNKRKRQSKELKLYKRYKKNIIKLSK